MSNPKILNILTDRLRPNGQQRLFEFLEVVDTDTAARFRGWLSSAADTEVEAVADLLNRVSHGREFAGWWRTHDKAPAAQQGETWGQSWVHAPVEELPSQARGRSANRDLKIGGAWLVGGILVTVASYSMAANSPGGDHYIIATGAIVYGAFRIFRGLNAG